MGMADQDPAQRHQEDVEFAAHYATDDQLECVQALLLLAGLDHQQPSNVRVFKRPRRRARPAGDGAA
jgi:hypothetical protein